MLPRLALFRFVLARLSRTRFPRTRFAGARFVLNFGLSCFRIALARLILPGRILAGFFARRAFVRVGRFSLTFPSGLLRLLSLFFGGTTLGLGVHEFGRLL